MLRTLWCVDGECSDLDLAGFVDIESDAVDAETRCTPRSGPRWCA
jgi:hypothetical protein